MTFPRPKPVFNARQTLGAIATAAVIAALGGAAIYAATNTGSHAGPWMHAPGTEGWGRPCGTVTALNDGTAAATAVTP